MVFAGSKISISGVLPAKFPSKSFFGKIFIAPKDSFFNFKGSLFCYFQAFVLISAIISISEDFGSLLPARPVIVKLENHSFDWWKRRSNRNQYEAPSYIQLLFVQLF